MPTFFERLKAVFGRAELTHPPVPFQLLDDQQQIQQRLPLFDWGPFELRQMLQQYMDADFSLAEEFYENCRRDGRIFDGLRRRGNAVTRYPQVWDHADNAPPEVRVAALKLQKIWGESCLTKTDLAEANRRYAFFGLCFLYRSYRPVGGVMAPKFTPWTMRGITYNASKRVFYIPQRNAPPKEVPLEGNDEFIVISGGGERPWVDGACVPLTKMFLLVNQGWDKWSQHADIQALALRVLKTPFMSRESLESGEAYKIVRALKSGDTWLNPQGQGNTPGYELGLVESKHADAYKTFERMLANIWTVIAVILLGHNLSQEVKGGSLAATEAALEVTREVSESDAAIITSCLMPVFVEWLIANFSVETRLSWPDDVTEYISRWWIDAREPEDEQRKATVCGLRATALKTTTDAMKTAGVDFETAQIDWHKTLEACGAYLLPLPDGQRRPPVKFAPPPAPPALPVPGKQPKLMHGSARRPLLLAAPREAETEGERGS